MSSVNYTLNSKALNDTAIFPGPNCNDDCESRWEPGSKGPRMPGYGFQLWNLSEYRPGLLTKEMHLEQGGAAERLHCQTTSGKAEAPAVAVGRQSMEGLMD